MSDFSLTLVLQIKTSKIINDTVSHGDRYLGMTAAMTQAPVPTATGAIAAKSAHAIEIKYFFIT